MKDDSGRIAYHSHEVMEQIKVELKLDGDLAATIMNALTYVEEQDAWPMVLYCGHTAPKLEKLIKLLEESLNIEQRKE